MARLSWDQDTERFWESGVDRGVLYLANNSGVAWNGLTSVEESTGFGQNEPLYFDGVHYADHATINGFTAAIKAYTYPDEFLPFQGFTPVTQDQGLYLTNQPAQSRFGLTYRSLVGNDDEGSGHGYKIHLCYNLAAQPATMSYKTLAAKSDPFEFTWLVTGIPAKAVGVYPTAYVCLDSRNTAAELMAEIEDVLYGTESTTPRLPSLQELVTFVSAWAPEHEFLRSVLFAVDSKYPTGLPKLL